MKRICVVVGTRPEAIKMAPVYFALQESSELQPLLLSTGQHREMLDQALGAFGITPDHDLKLMQPGQTLADVTGRVVSKCFDFLQQEKPDAVLVQGDTTTVFSAALASFYAGIPVGHIEAGLRTYNPMSPWPEEMNRRLTSPLARWHFAPTPQSRQHLLDEKIPEADCYVTGNTVVDALLWMRDKITGRSDVAKRIAQQYAIDQSFFDAFLGESASARWILMTGHRRESFGGGFEGICEGVLKIGKAHPDVGILYPVHLNPNVRATVMAMLGEHKNIQLIEPVGYEDFIWLMNRCTLLLSDSGGVQEEAPSLGKPVLVTRETTERPEGVEAGTCRLVGSDPQAILRETSLLLSDPEEYQRRSELKNPYGDGTAATKIAGILSNSLTTSN